MLARNKKNLFRIFYNFDFQLKNFYEAECCINAIPYDF